MRRPTRSAAASRAASVRTEAKDAAPRAGIAKAILQLEWESI